MPQVVPRSAALSPCRRRAGFTLVEILVTAVLSLIILGSLVTLFGTMGQGINDSRATLELNDQLRVVQAKLQNDLANLTVTTAGTTTLSANPPKDPGDSLGYFEYTEGPIGPVLIASDVARNTDEGKGDTTAGDIDDTLQFTRQMDTSSPEPFVGRVLMKRYPRPGETATGNDGADYCLIRAASSEAAEVAWFLRGGTLYRRVLLVLPNFDADLRSTTTPGEMQLSSTSPYGAVTGASLGQGFYYDYDVAVCWDRDTGTFRAASLGDLTMPEYRFAHRSVLNPTVPPVPQCHPRWQTDWGTSTGSTHLPPLGLPTLVEGSHSSWVAGGPLPSGISTSSGSDFDPWRAPFPWDGVNHQSGNLTGYPGLRLAEDVVLTNVLSFDVKVWDPGAPVMRKGTLVLLPGDPGYAQALHDYTVLTTQDASSDPRPIGYGAFVDLNYMARLGGATVTWKDALRGTADAPHFNGAGANGSGLAGTAQFDPSSTSSFSVAQSSVFDTWTRKYEEEASGSGMTSGTWTCPPPYLDEINAIQVKIRVFDPESRQIREVTVVQRFPSN